MTGTIGEVGGVVIFTYRRNAPAASSQPPAAPAAAPLRAAPRTGDGNPSVPLLFAMAGLSGLALALLAKRRKAHKK
jgi:LPXTG-motif cell wall-anchored protein